MSRDDDDDFGAMGSSRSDKPKGGGGLSTGAIVGIVVGVLLLCTCLGCGGCCALNWDDFKTKFDKELKKAQEQQQKK